MNVQQVADDRFAVPVQSALEGQWTANRLRALPDAIEAVGGIRTVEVLFDPTRVTAAEFQTRLVHAFEQLEFDDALSSTGRVHEIPVHYGDADGPDLHAVCEQLGLSQSTIVEHHTATEWQVAMLGFTPGFAYLDGPSNLAVPRRSTPRSSVPAGSVGLAGGRTGLYALPGPGGWQLIGRTDASLFRHAGEDPFLLRAGDRVRFVSVNTK